MEFKMRRYVRKLKVGQPSKVVVVYEANSWGFGDYLRGCFCMLQVSRRMNIPFDLDWSSHPIYPWLKPCTSYPRLHVDVLPHKPVTDNVVYLIDKVAQAKGEYVCVCNKPPLYPITPEERLFIRDKLLPTDELLSYIQQTKEDLDIRGPYGILHLRCGDHCLVDNKQPNYDGFLQEIQKLTLDSIPYIVLGDSTQMKIRLKELYPDLRVMVDQPQHTSHCTNSDQLKDTMRDFFLLTQAQQVYSFSVYGHGSGFSAWACQLYNIPYHSKCI